MQSPAAGGDTLLRLHDLRLQMPQSNIPLIQGLDLEASLWFATGVDGLNIA